MKNVRYQRRLALLAGLLLTMAAVPFTAFSGPGHGPNPGDENECDFIAIKFPGNPDLNGDPHIRPCFLPFEGPIMDRDLKTGKTIFPETYYQGCSPCDQRVLGVPGEAGNCYLPL
jgi:hypothetical protein